MTWKRVVTAAVLIPFVVGLVLWGSTAILALGVALVVMLAMFEYFALGEAIGHRAYRFWTATCALLLIYAQWRMAYSSSFEVYRALTFYANTWWFAQGFPSAEGVLFVYLLGSAVLTLATRRPL